MCIYDAELGGCTKRDMCRFCHSTDELRAIYKKMQCHAFHRDGHCPRGSKCGYYHDISEKRFSEAPCELGGEDEATKRARSAPAASAHEAPADLQAALCTPPQSTGLCAGRASRSSSAGSDFAAADFRAQQKMTYPFENFRGSSDSWFVPPSPGTEYSLWGPAHAPSQTSDTDPRDRGG